MITTKTQLAKRLASYKPNEKLFVMLWTKDEFDDANYNSDAPLTKKEWEEAIELVDAEMSRPRCNTSCDADSYETLIGEQIISSIEEARQ
jgi:hypothetical protein